MAVTRIESNKDVLSMFRMSKIRKRKKERERRPTGGGRCGGRERGMEGQRDQGRDRRNQQFKVDGHHQLFCPGGIS